MCNYGGFILVVLEALGLLALAAILASLGGMVWLALVALACDGRAWLALAGAVLAIALLWLPRMRQEIPAQSVQSLDQDAPDYCERCGSECPGLICPMCGDVALDKIA